MRLRAQAAAGGWPKLFGGGGISDEGTTTVCDSLSCHVIF
jgi:hypothetical protein